MLNLKQTKAVEANNRFIFLLAGAGTGKTTVIIRKIKRLLSQGIKPENVLVLSFTRKSVADLKRRFQKEDTPIITTFHGFCYKELETNIKINIADENMLILNGYSKDELTTIDYYKRNDKTSNLVKRYNRFLKEHNLLDYTDLEKVLLKKLKNNDSYSKEIKLKYKYIFVDEFQDTSITQFMLLKEMKNHSNIFCVGDPNQSIYSFRGASKKVIDKYIKTFKAKVYLLNENYRSGTEIIKVSNNLIKYNKSYLHFNLIANKVDKGLVILKNFKDIDTQSKYIINQIRILLNEGYKQEQITIIYRNHYYANDLKQKLYKTYFERISLLTIHQVKGLEFDCVFMIGLEEGKLPFKNANIEEERRLFYVGITRAKKHLYLLTIIKKKKQSRFITECFK